MARSYRQLKRGEAAEDMRQRIIGACFDLHAEKGMVATTMKQIAKRAGVSVGSVYHHFPTYDDAIRACGAHAFAQAPSPSTAIFQGVEGRAQRVERMARAFFHLFDRLKAFGFVQAEQDALPVLRAFVEDERRMRHALARAALGDEAPERAATLAALLDHGVYQALRNEGLSVDDAARRIADVANAWLGSPPNA